MGCRNCHVSQKLKFTWGCCLDEKGIEVIVHSKIMDPQGHFIIFKVEFNDNLYTLINMYASNKDKDSVNFLEAL